MKRLLLAACLMVSACAPVIEVHKMGNEYVQDAYSRKLWSANWQRTTICWKLDGNGYCPKEDTRVETRLDTAMEAAGPKMAVAAMGSVPLALGLGVGLSQMHAARMTQSVSGTQTNIPVFESPGTVVR